MSSDTGEFADAAELDAGAEELSPTRVDLDCPGCSARLTWDPAADALSCEYCGHHQAVERSEDVIEERPLHAAGDAARGFGIELRVLRCQNCSARVALEVRDTSAECVFCGSASVLAQEANRNAIRPESLIPLDVSRSEVADAFQKWIGGLWFRPSALKRLKAFDAVGVYVPAWTFDCEVHSSWSADSGTYYYVTQSYTVTVNGKRQRRTRRVRKTRWRPAWGERDDRFDDYQVLASQAVDSGLAGRLGSFETSALVPYQPEYLAGWRAEEYSLDLEAAWSLGQQSIASIQREACAGDIPGDTYRDLKVRNSFSEVHWKHVLLPIWSLTYSFRGEVYAVLVHGQHGTVVGRAPYSWWKLLGFVLTLLGLGGLIALLANGGL